MKKTLHIDERLLEEARAASAAATDTETVRLGLEALIRHSAYERMRALRGSEPDARDVPRRRVNQARKRRRALATLQGILSLLLLIPCVASGQPGGQQFDAQVSGTLLHLLEDNPPKHVVFSGSARVYLNSVVALEPEIGFAKGFGEFNPYAHRAILFIPNVTVELLWRDAQIRPYLKGGLGVTRHRWTQPPPDERRAETGINISGGGGARIFLNSRFFVSPEFRVGVVPRIGGTITVGYIFQADQY